MRDQEPGVVAGRHAGERANWIQPAGHCIPTVWMATPDGLVLIDLIAVERAANGLRKGWTLTPEEARYTASLLFRHQLSYSLIASRVGVSGATLKIWFLEQAVPGDERLARTGTRTTLRPPVQCGTRSGYDRHLRRGETTCQPCKQAKAAADRHYRLHGTSIGAPEPAAAAL